MYVHVARVRVAVEVGRDLTDSLCFSREVHHASSADLSRGRLTIENNAIQHAMAWGRD